MKLLILTQKININDPVLGFFHNWVAEFAKKFEQITVICLEKGESNLPNNVKVLSLGKESGASRLKYVSRFYKYIFSEKNNYDSVFVHMNQEYVLLGGLFWLLKKKKVFMWRNHHVGNFLTKLSGLFCDKVLCTSKFSYTASFKNCELMPVGVDTNIFKTLPGLNRVPQSILSLGRIAPVKRVDILLEALGILKRKGISFTANIYGDALSSDQRYKDNLINFVKANNLGDSVSFKPSIPNYKTPEIYNQHQIFVNLSSDGMYDKTIFEAMACGCTVIASNKNLKGVMPDALIASIDPVDLANKLEAQIGGSKNNQFDSQKLVTQNSLLELSDKLFELYSNNS